MPRCVDDARQRAAVHLVQLTDQLELDHGHDEGLGGHADRDGEQQARTVPVGSTRNPPTEPATAVEFDALRTSRSASRSGSRTLQVAFERGTVADRKPWGDLPGDVAQPRDRHHRLRGATAAIDLRRARTRVRSR